MFLKILQNSQENTCARVYFLPQPATLLKETLAQVFSCEFCEYLFYRTPPSDCFPTISELWAAIQPVCGLRAVSPETYSESRWQKMELFAKLVNGFPLWTKLAKSSILDFWLSFEYATGVNDQAVSWGSYQSVLSVHITLSLHCT